MDYPLVMLSLDFVPLSHATSRSPASGHTPKYFPVAVERTVCSKWWAGNSDSKGVNIVTGADEESDADSGEDTGADSESGTRQSSRRRFLKVGGGVVGAGVLSRLFLVRPDIPVARLKQDYANAASQFLELGGATVHVRDEGPRDAPAVVLLHGFGSSLHTWNGWVQQFGERFRVVRLDLPGFGLTGPNEQGEYGDQYYVELVAEVVAEVGLEEFAIGGNSMGGEVAWRYALDHLDQVTRLLLVDAAGYPSEQGGDPLLLTLGQYPVLDLIPRYALPRAAVRQSLESAWGDPSKLTDDLVERYHRLLLRAGNRAAIVRMAKSAETSRADEIPDLDVPTLVMWGERDTWIPPADARQFVEDIPDASLVTYPKLGHVPNEEAPAETAPDAAAFLSR
jgi:pimeloyl-ACP methyl ester carboxylesterase